MNRRMEQLLEAWFDGEASPEDAREAKRLLESDPGARAHLEFLQSVRGTIPQTYRETEAPEAAWTQVQEQLDSGKRPLIRRHPFAVFSSLLAGAAAVALLILLPGNPGFEGTAVPPVDSQSLRPDVELVETGLDGATSVVFVDPPSGWTVIWVLEETPAPDS